MPEGSDAALRAPKPPPPPTDGDEEAPEAPIIDGRYEVLSVLGEGGFGVVYKARQISTGQKVAVKLLHGDLMEDEEHAREYIARFEREMRVIGSMKHPNIVRLIDKGIVPENDELFMALEFIDGRSLFDVLQSDGPLSLSETMHLMLQVLDALHAAHSLGIVHRDLKPHNIMLTSTGYRRNAMVLDFGIAGVVEGQRGVDYRTLTKASEIRGTPSYMAPEQLRSKQLTPQSDLYAWGLVFIECLTAQPVVDGETPFDIALWQVGDDRIEIPEALPLNDGLRDVLRRVTDKDFGARYTSASEVFEAIEDLGHGALAGDRGDVAIAVGLGTDPRRQRAIEDAHTAALDGSKLELDTDPGIEEEDPEKDIATMMLDGNAVEQHMAEKERNRDDDAGVDQSAVDTQRRSRPSRPAVAAPPEMARTSPFLVAAVAVAVTLAAAAGLAWWLWPVDAAESAASQTSTSEVDAAAIVRAATEDPSLTSIQTGMDKLAAALKDAPEDPRLLGGLARLHAMLASYGWQPVEQAFTEARELAGQALEITPDQSDALLARALVALHFERDHAAAESAFRRAIEQDPSLGAEYARFFLAPLQRFDEARARIRSAATEAPDSTRVALAEARVHYLTGDHDKALSRAAAIIENNPKTSFLAHFQKGQAHAARDELSEAQGAFDTARTLQDESLVLGALGNAYARAGNPKRATELLDLLQARAAVDGRVLPEHIAWIYIGLGQPDEAFEWLEKALEMRSSGLIELATNPIYAPIRDDERFSRLVTRAGLKTP